MMRTSKNARIAGAIYLLLAILAPIRLLYIPGKLFVQGDATATAANIAAHEALFRFGMVTEMLCGVVLIFLVLALYRLFRDTDRRLAILVVILGGVLPATVDFVIVLNDAAALILVQGAGYLDVFDKPQRDALAMLFLNLHHQQVLVLEILWGLWLFPLGALVYRSGFLPRFLGLWLFVNGAAYLATSLTGLLVPEHLGLVAKITLPALLGEMALMLWLAIMGAKDPPAPAKAA
jgi:hypothetical protein